MAVHPNRNKDDPVQPDPPDLLDAMPQTVRDEAKSMSEDPDLMERVVDDIGALGVAGEHPHG